MAVRVVMHEEWQAPREARTLARMSGGLASGTSIGMELGGEDHVVATADRECRADDDLRLALGVDVGLTAGQRAQPTWLARPFHRHRR